MQTNGSLMLLVSHGEVVARIDSTCTPSGIKWIQCWHNLAIVVLREPQCTSRLCLFIYTVSQVSKAQDQIK